MQFLFQKGRMMLRRQRPRRPRRSFARRPTMSLGSIRWADLPADSRVATFPGLDARSSGSGLVLEAKVIVLRLVLGVNCMKSRRVSIGAANFLHGYCREIGIRVGEEMIWWSRTLCGR